MSYPMLSSVNIIIHMSIKDYSILGTAEDSSKYIAIGSQECDNSRERTKKKLIFIEPLTHCSHSKPVE